jgi:tetratricopeptide (TPR) repeat protein
MRPSLAFILTLMLALHANADDWTGKTIRVKEDRLKLGRKFGGGLVRDGAVLDKARTYIVKSDDGIYLELDGGFVFRSDAVVVADAKLFPKEKAKQSDPAAVKGPWFGKKVLPRRDPETIRMGDWVDGQPVYWTPNNLLNCWVREDRDGFLRVFDMRREGWVNKDDMVTAEDAPAWWDKEVKRKPNDAFVWFMRGHGWLDKKEYDNAIKDLTEAIRLRPGSVRNYNARGVAWRESKRYDRAIEDLSEAIRLNPKDPYPHTNRGEAWYHKGDYDKAIADEDEALRLDPKFTHAWLRRGDAWLAKKELTKAIADYTEAIRLDPKYVRALNSRGSVWQLKKEYDKAIADYTEAVRHDPKYAGAFSNRGYVWRLKKEYDKAIADYTEAIRLDPNYILPRNNRGYVWQLKKEYDKAIADYTEAVRLDPKYIVALNNRGDVWQLKKEYDKAIADFDEVLLLAPKNIYATTSRGAAFYAKKEYARARSAQEAALALDPKSALALYRLSWMYASCPDARFRNGEKAIDLGKKLVELYGSSWNHHAALAAAYAEAGDFELAVAEERRGIDMLKAETSPDADSLKKAGARLELYRARKPYRDQE